MLEAECTRCEEIFVPHGVEPEDLIHGVTEIGDDCGGIGVILGQWSPDPTDTRTFDEVHGELVNLSLQEKHGLENPDCDNRGCEFHHPDTIATLAMTNDLC